MGYTLLVILGEMIIESYKSISKLIANNFEANVINYSKVSAFTNVYNLRLILRLINKNSPNINEGLKLTEHSIHMHIRQFNIQ